MVHVVVTANRVPGQGHRRSDGNAVVMPDREIQSQHLSSGTAGGGRSARGACSAVVRLIDGALNTGSADGAAHQRRFNLAIASWTSGSCEMPMPLA